VVGQTGTVVIGGTEWVAICGGGAWYKTTRVIRGEEQVVPKICRTESKRWGRGWCFGYKDFWAV